MRDHLPHEKIKINSHAASLRHEWSHGFTLMELIICVAICALMIALLFPAGKGVLTGAQKGKSLLNLRTIGTGITQYLADNQNQYPPLFATAWHAPYWSDRLTSYLPPPPRNLKGPVGNTITASAVMMDPLVKTGQHHNLGDYGANDQVFIYPSAATPSKSAASITRPSKVAIVISASQPYNGKPIGCWYIAAGAYLAGSTNTSTVTGLPYDRGTGSIFCLFADGRSEAVPVGEFFERKQEFLVPE